jgi:hypothetical protein
VDGSAGMVAKKCTWNCSSSLGVDFQCQRFLDFLYLVLHQLTGRFTPHLIIRSMWFREKIKKHFLQLKRLTQYIVLDKSEALTYRSPRKLKKHNAKIFA